MSLRTKSRRSQWRCWAILALVGLVVYAIVLRLIGSEADVWLVLARQNVAAFAAVSFVFGWLAYELRWDGVNRDHSSPTLFPLPATPTPTPAPTPTPSPAPTPTPTPAPTPTPTQAGEAEWLEASKLPHSRIPVVTNARDQDYLMLVNRSAELGYASALAKLGECAYNQKALAEAYYWYFRARKQGVRNLDGRLRGIRVDWQRAGCPGQQNWYLLQDRQSHSIARALLDRDTGRNAKDAATFLDSVGF